MKAKQIATIIIAVTMVLSIFGYGIRFFSSEQSKTVKKIYYIMQGPVDKQTESMLISKGFTILELFYNQSLDPSIKSAVESLPRKYTTDSGAIQLIVWEIPSNETMARIRSMKGEEEVEMNMTEIKNSLCALLYITPVECLNIT